jgi:hypothetical protein
MKDDYGDDKNVPKVLVVQLQKLTLRNQPTVIKVATHP